MDPIMSLLPNDLIMLIIRDADGGRTSHKRKLLPLLKDVLVKDDTWSLLACIDIETDYMDELAALGCHRRHHFHNDEAYMDVIRNPEEYW